MKLKTLQTRKLSRFNWQYQQSFKIPHIMLDFPRSREPKPLWSSCFLISPALQDKKFVGNLIRVHYQHEKKQCEVHSIFIFSIFFSNCRLKPVKNNSRMPVWQKSTEQLKCDKIWEIFWSHVVNISQKKSVTYMARWYLLQYPLTDWLVCKFPLVL